MSVFGSYRKKHQYLICVDSDGCVMDTMNCKHFHCFGPNLVAVWQLERWEEEILRRWNEINLFQMTRGINRFQALAKILGEIDAKYITIPGVAALKHWVDAASTLSNDSILMAVAEETDPEGKQCLQKALDWSLAVNEAVAKLPEELKKPFKGVREALRFAAQYADVAVVSGANRDAVEQEWETYGLLPFTDVILAQDCGNVESCLQGLIGHGYHPENVMMVGDSPEDCYAAESVGIHFYPILVNWEEECWEAFSQEALPKLLSGEYAQCQIDKTLVFVENLGG